MERYPPANQIASPRDLRLKYEAARAEINNYKNMAHDATVTARDLAKDKYRYKEEAKVAGRQLLEISAKEKAHDEAKKAAYWSGGATVGITILYEMWKVIGFPGGWRWMDFWEHEAVYGVMVWVSTMTMGVIYRASHKDT